MPYPHRIRLRGPWGCVPLARTVVHADGRVETVEDLPPYRSKMTMPCRWNEGGLVQFAGRVRFERGFGYPGRIDSHERVWLTFAGADFFSTVWLNEQLLGGNRGAFNPFEFEGTSLLKPRNQLVVEVDCPALHADAVECPPLPRGAVEPGNGGLWGEVAMEVRAEVFLRDLRLWATRAGETWHLHAAGEVVGETEQPLELSIIVAGDVLLHKGGVQAHPRGVVFQETVLVPRARPWRIGQGEWVDVRVEVIAGGRCLCSLDRPVAFRDRECTSEEFLRAHGAAISLQPLGEPEAFYEACDRRVAFLRQMLPFAHTDDHDLVLGQVRAVVIRLQPHPTILEWVYPQGETEGERELAHKVGALAEALDPSRECRLASICSPRGA